METATNFEYLKAVSKDKNSAIKLNVNGKPMLAIINIKVIEENKGIVKVIPLKYFISLEWNLTYSMADDINKAELTNPWANIIVIDAINPSIECANTDKVTNPICATDE